MGTNLPLEMETFPISFLLKASEQEYEETNRDSYGCLKEWDKDNRKEKRREARSIR